MKSIHDYRKLAYLIICIGVALALISSVLPHYDQSHRLALDIFLIGIMPYALYSLFTVLSMRVLLLASGLVIIALDILVKIPGWWHMKTRDVAEALYTVPIISSLVVIPITLLIYWLNRTTTKS